MKLDIEGFEHAGLQGASALMSQFTPCVILMEYHTVLLKTAGFASPMDTIRLLEAHGYEVKQPADRSALEVETGEFDIELRHSTMAAGGTGSCWERCVH